MITAKQAIENAYRDYIYTAKQELSDKRAARAAFDRIKYRTKPGGGHYAKTEDNFIYQDTPVIFRKDRRHVLYKWLEIHSRADVYSSGVVYTYNAKKDFMTVKAEIEQTKKNLDNDIKELEKIAAMSFEKFVSQIF